LQDDEYNNIMRNFMFFASRRVIRKFRRDWRVTCHASGRGEMHSGLWLEDGKARKRPLRMLRARWGHKTKMDLEGNEWKDMN
jgi:hypothetical protein